MDSIYILGIVVLMIMCLAYLFFNRDIFSPTIIVCFVFLLSILSVFFNKDEWEVYYHWNSVFVLLLGIICFFLGEVLVYVLLRPEIKYLNKLETSKVRFIKIDEWKINFSIVFACLTLILYFKEVYRVSIIGGNTGGITNMMVVYREYIARDVSSIGNGINEIVLQMAKVTNITALIFAFVIINNFFYNKSLKKEKKKIFIITIYFIQMLLSGARQSIINFSGAILLIYYIVWLRNIQWTKVISYKFIKIGAISISLLFFMFFLSRGIVGRTGNLQEESIVTYITHYLGGSIQAFDLYMQNPPIGSELVGSETFSSLYSFAQKFISVKTQVLKSLEFRFIGNNRANVYTSFRRYYQDFGYSGVIILSLIMSMFYSVFYYKKVKYSNSSYKENTTLLIYALIFFPLIFMAIEECFFSTILSFNYLIYIVLLKIMCYFFLKFKIKFR